MFKRSRHLFVHKKKTYKNSIFLLISVICLLMAYCSIHRFLQEKFSIFLENQQSFLQNQNISLKFQYIPNPSWQIWPHLTVIYPTLQRNNSNTATQFFWQAKQAKVTYSLWHPLSILINIDGNQLFCIDQNSNSCLQIHGKSWKIRLPLLGSNINKSITLQCDETFYTNNTRPSGTLQSLQLTKIQAYLYWNNNLIKTDSSLAFSKINIHKALIHLTTFQPQKLHNIQLQAALLQTNNSQDLSHNLYKLLIQQADLSWNSLSTHISGKLYIPYPKIIPTGEFAIHLNGINQTIYQQLIPATCCQKLKEELAKTPLPSELNFTISIRKGNFYLGGFPLEPSWYSYTSDIH